MFRDEAVEAVHGLKAGTSLRVDNIPSELLKNGGEYTRTVLTAICQKALETKKWPKGVDSIARHPFTKERQPQAMSKLSYHQPSQPSCPEKTMLRVVLNRLKAKFEEIEAEERVDFRPDRSTVELSSKVELSQRSTYNISAICSTTP